MTRRSTIRPDEPSQGLSGRYGMVRPIAEGARSTVYLAVHAASQRLCAVKVTTDDAGRFALPSGFSPSPRMWMLKTYAPGYAFYHPSYGLQRGAKQEEDQLVLRGSLARAEQAKLDLRPYCRGEIDDAGARRIAELACDPVTPSR